ncbi:hypothetical protein [Sinorhizobium meliloti]|uniref:hypothetical protein n=1 Tax=Rhizobium meliloti TaxID=382 RepID=UPI001294D7E9|nr:hypothetical protein [Sinorhizobium meliloti]MQX58522.1 hypothetical protein [Sinorhizobium meliloti]
MQNTSWPLISCNAIFLRTCIEGGSLSRIDSNDRAVESLELAVKSLDGPKPGADGLKEEVLSYLLQSDVCVVPRTNISGGATPKAEQENPAERGAFE